MMKYSIINLLICIIFIFNNAENSTANVAMLMEWGQGLMAMTQKFTNAKNECFNMGKIAPAELQSIDFTQIFSRNQKCYLACIYKLAGVMHLGRFNPDGFIQMIPEETLRLDKTGILQRFKSFSARCNAAINQQFSAGNASDECDIAGLIAKCFKQQGNSPLSQHG
uniref:General odorant-binding protein n=1 Tax=Chrysopa pallens TaxID=417485 RepID=A0A191US22_CHRPA|nr:general odorant-binding protein [Chrysopa pallens]